MKKRGNGKYYLKDITKFDKTHSEVEELEETTPQTQHTQEYNGNSRTDRRIIEETKIVKSSKMKAKVNISNGENRAKKGTINAITIEVTRSTNLDVYSLMALKNHLKQKGLKNHVTKAQLIARIKQYLPNTST